jgi:hypothetical protein
MYTIAKAKSLPGMINAKVSTEKSITGAVVFPFTKSYTPPACFLWVGRSG